MEDTHAETQNRIRRVSAAVIAAPWAMMAFWSGERLYMKFILGDSPPLWETSIPLFAAYLLVLTHCGRMSLASAPKRWELNVFLSVSIITTIIVWAVIILSMVSYLTERAWTDLW